MARYTNYDKLINKWYNLIFEEMKIKFLFYSENGGTYVKFYSINNLFRGRDLFPLQWKSTVWNIRYCFSMFEF